MLWKSNDNLKLVKHVNNKKLLNAYESMNRVTYTCRLNKDRGTIPNSPLYTLVERN